MLIYLLFKLTTAIQYLSTLNISENVASFCYYVFTRATLC